VTARNPNIKISAKVASNHGAILKKDFPSIAEALCEVAALDAAGAEDLTSALTISQAAAFAGVTGRLKCRQTTAAGTRTRDHEPVGVVERGVLMLARIRSTAGCARSRRTGPLPTCRSPSR
jgi:hypothetical protein